MVQDFSELAFSLNLFIVSNDAICTTAYTLWYHSELKKNLKKCQYAKGPDLSDAALMV